jgi:hypothetical protein
VIFAHHLGINFYASFDYELDQWMRELARDMPIMFENDAQIDQYIKEWVVPVFKHVTQLRLTSALCLN